MNVLVTLTPGGVGYQAGTGEWWQTVDYICEDDQWNGYCAVQNVSMPVSNSTQLSTWISEVKSAVIASISTAGGPTVSASDITILGGPTV